MKNIAKYIWILLYLSYVVIYLYAFSQLEDLSTIEKSTIISLLPLSLIVLGIISEFLFPHNKAYNKINLQSINNIAYFFISNYAELFGKTAALFIIPFVLQLNNSNYFDIWPKNTNIILQVVLAILIHDFVYYWYHRFSHKSSFLWRFHRLHHSSSKLNLIALGKFNFFDILVEFLILTFTFQLLNIPLNVFYIMQGFMIPATLLSHANIDTRLPKLLNWIVISPSTHRIHHAKSAELHDRNFGGFTLFWDLVFKTYEPGYKLNEFELGIENHETSKWIWLQFFDFLKK